MKHGFELRAWVNIHLAGLWGVWGVTFSVSFNSGIPDLCSFVSETSLFPLKAFSIKIHLTEEVGVSTIDG